MERRQVAVTSTPDETPSSIMAATGHKSKFISYVNGPLLFTAPHSGKLKRGGVEYGEKRRTHLREQYTSVLAMRFALETANLFKETGKKNG